MNKSLQFNIILNFPNGKYFNESCGKLQEKWQKERKSNIVLNTILLVTRKMQVKTTMRCLFNRMKYFFFHQKGLYVARMQSNHTSHKMLVECEMAPPLWKTDWRCYILKGLAQSYHMTQQFHS